MRIFKPFFLSGNKETNRKQGFVWVFILSIIVVDLIFKIENRMGIRIDQDKYIKLHVFEFRIPPIYACMSQKN